MPWGAGIASGSCGRGVPSGYNSTDAPVPARPHVSCPKRCQGQGVEEHPASRLLSPPRRNRRRVTHAKSRDETENREQGPLAHPEALPRALPAACPQAAALGLGRLRDSQWSYNRRKNPVSAGGERTRRLARTSPAHRSPPTPPPSPPPAGWQHPLPVGCRGDA